MNKQETMKTLSMLASVWSGETIDDDKVTAYQMVLDDVPYELVQRAVKVLLRSAKFFPKPSEIYEIVESEALPLKSSGECWEVVQEQVRFYGHKGWASVDFGDDAILEAVKAVTWRRICLDEDQQFIRRDFDKALEVVQQRHRRELRSGSLDLVTGSKVKALDE